MKILHLTHGYLPESTGGVELYLKDLLASQRAAGMEVSVLTGSHHPWEEPGIEILEVEGVTVRRLHRDDLYFDLHAKLYHPDAERLVEEVLLGERPDVVHVHQWIRLTCNLVEIAARHGIPAVVTLHDLYTSCPRAFRVRDEKACFAPLGVTSCLDCVPRFGHESPRELREGIELFHDQYQAELGMARSVLVADAATADLVCEKTGFDRRRIEILPLGYVPRFGGPGATPPAPLPGADAPFRFAYWGNLTHRKGAQVLARAFRELMAQGPARPVELHLFGRVDTDALDAELCATLDGLPAIFHGRYEYDALARAGVHMAIFPMLCFETFAFVLDECFELGLPCIVADIGAVSSRAGEAALRFPPEDVSALAATMNRVLADPSLRDTLAAKIVPSALGPEDHVVRLRRIYDAARTAPAPTTAPIPAWRRARLLMLQRESAQARLCPEGGPR